jgi:hypothetical protein
MTKEKSAGANSIMAENQPILDTLQAAAKNPVEQVNHPAQSDCILWDKGKTEDRYGALRVGGKVVYAHRHAWERVHGRIPDGLYVLHRCDVRHCINVDHLFLGTHADNMRDMAEKGRANIVPKPGESNPSAKLTGGQVHEIRRLYDEDRVTYKDLAKRFGVSPSQIGNIVRGEKWNATEAVSHPSHYNMGGPKGPDGTAKYEAIKVIEDWGLGFKFGNAIKYILRAPHKGTELDDLKKARWYLDRSRNPSLYEPNNPNAMSRMLVTAVCEAWKLPNLLSSTVYHVSRGNVRDALVCLDAHIAYLESKEKQA